MISAGNHVKFARFVLPADLYTFTRLEISYQFHLLKWPLFFRAMCNKTIIRFGFCYIQNNQGLGNLYPDLDYSRYHKNLIQ